MKKKLIVLGLITAMTFSMVACGNDDKSDNEITTATETNKNDDTKNNEEDSADDKTDKEDSADKKDELTDEYLLALPETDVKEFFYKEVEGGILLDGYWNDPDGETIMVLPNQIDGKEVVELSKEMFKARYCKAVVVNKNIKTIPYQCFQSSHIEKIILPEGLESISMDAFYLSHTEYIKLPSTLKSISNDAFGSSSIKEITIPKNVETIMGGAFSLCSNLETVVFEGCPELGDSVFLMSDNIKKVICYDGNIEFSKDEFINSEALNPDASDEDKQTTVTLVAPAGSKVEQYAKDNGLNFEVLD